MAYSEDVNVNFNVLTGTMSGVTAIMGGMSALTSSFGAMGTAAGNTFGELDGLIISATSLISIFAVKSAEAFGEYEQGLKIVQTVSNQSSYAMNELIAKANDMSVAYRTSIGDINDGLQTLGRAGLNSVNEQLEVLESGLQTAKLEGRNLNGVLEEIIQNTAMLGGDLKSVNFGDQAEYLNSLMVSTSMTAPINSHDISQTLQYAGGTAAAAGANLENKDKLEDLMGTIAAFAQKGVKGSMSGTALRAFFTKPASQDESVTDALGSIGLSPEDLWEDGGESMKKVSDQVGLIKRRMDALNLSTMEQVEIWGKIVGPKMGQQMMKLDSSSIKEITRDIEDAKSAEELAQQTLYTYHQKVAEMQQQGEMAFREFGEKVAMWLTPPVEIITKILGLLSDPHINMATFATVGALLYQGFRKAWTMASTLFTQIRTLISDAAMALQSFNGMAGGSATGFGQSAAQVDFLNAKLHETDATLQAIQAKSMGIKPGYIMPGDHGLQAVPKGTLKAYEENVVIDKAGVMGGAKGQIYPGQYAAEFEKNIKKEIIALEEQHEAKKIATEEEILVLEEKKHNAQRIADDRHIAAMKEAKAAVAMWNKTGFDPIAQKEMLRDSAYKEALATYGSVAKIPRHQLQLIQAPYLQDTEDRGLNPKTWYDEQKSLIDTQRRQWLNPITRGYNEQINALKEETNLSKEQIQARKTVLKGLEKEGTTNVQTRMDMMTTKQFRNWMKSIDESDPIQAYSKMRTQEMIEKHPDLYRKYAQQGYMPRFISERIPKSHPNMSIMEQAENNGMPQAYIDADKARLAREKALWNGELSYVNKARSLTNARLNAWGNAMNKGINSMKNFPSAVSNFGSQLKKEVFGSTYVRDNAMTLQTKALGAITGGKLDVAGASASQALQALAAELNLTKGELNVLLGDMEALAATGKYTEGELKVLGATADLLKQKLAEATATENMDEAATREHSLAMKEDMAAVIKHAGTQTIAGGAMGKLKAGAGALRGGLSSLVGFMGGPFMAGMMAVMVGMQQIQEQQQKWQEAMQKAETALSEATDKMTQAEDKIKEIYSSESSTLSEADLDRIVDAQYGAMQQAYIDNGASAQFGEMYTNEISSIGRPELTEEEKEQEKETGQPITPGAETMQQLEDSAKEITLAKDENITELKKNTVALNAATYAYVQAENQKQKQFNDGIWGWLGFGSAYSDGQISLGTNIIDIIKATSNLKNNGFLDSNSPLLTASQSDKNYAGSTELAGIFAADSKISSTSFKKWITGRDQEGDFEGTLQSVFGNDYDRIYSLMKEMDGKLDGSGVEALKSYHDTFGNMDADQASRAQLMFKDNKEDLQKLGKQMFRYEQQYGFDPKRTAMKDYDILKKASGKKGDASVLKSLNKAKLTVTDKNLVNTVNKLMRLSDGKLSESNILAMGQLQQLQDMNQIAQEQVAPGINQTVQGVLDTVTATGVAGSNAGSAASGAGAAANNAAAIANLLGAQAQETAEKAERLSLQRRGLISGDMTEDQFRTKLAKGELPLAEREILQTLEGSSWALQNGDFDPDHVKSNAERLWKNIDQDAPYQSKLDTATWGIAKYAEGAVTAAYNASDIGEYGGGQGSGGGSGGGGGSGKDSSDKNNQGTRKERVDLVLCNKKEIPKLNVNLFKKPPNFTVLNKNFKLRDIKINSQDKPKAIMNAIKNGIIETQKRMDPKIIQDDAAEFDPAEATEGKSVPKGNTKTTT